MNYNLTPNIRLARSRQPLPHNNKTSMSLGKLYPVSLVEVLPGDSWKNKTTAVVRCSTAFIKPIMDNIYMDVYHFFIPLRLCYDGLEGVFGKSSPSMYSTGTLNTIPTLPASTISEKSVGDYLGLPLGTIPAGCSVLPFRAFALVYNYWFRNENVTDETYVQLGSLGMYESPNSNAWSATNYFGLLPSVNKPKDYFTSCLPNTQKGTAVDIPVTLSGNAPVSASNEYWFKSLTGAVPPGYVNHLGVMASANISAGGSGGMLIQSPSDGIGISQYDKIMPNPDVLKANLSGVYGSGFSVNDLRTSLATQRLLEADARYGSRYNEYLLGHWSISNPDARLQLPEYLGGARIPIHIQQVAQTSETTLGNPIGKLGAFSLSGGESHFSKGFTEHGYILTVACIRQQHSYQQGVPKLFSRSQRAHFYDPVYANTSEQPVFKSEIFADSNSQTSLRDITKVLGFNQAWAEYRFLPNTVTGEMRSDATSSLDVWHLADDFASAPSLTSSFVSENTANIDRVLSVASSAQDNFIADFFFDSTAIRIMPVDSIPGLIDHTLT